MIARKAIVKEIAAVSKGAASFHGHLPSHLLYPLLGWMGGDPSDLSRRLATRMSLTTHVVVLTFTHESFDCGDYIGRG
jgi:hypothetical protein